jgi:hypothetical protein
MRCEYQKCRAVLVERIDRLGRVTYTCPGCARRKAGICAGCPAPVAGKAHNAKWCARCLVIQHQRYCAKYRKRDVEAYNKNAARRARERRAKIKATQPQRPWREIVAERTASRNASVTPAQRSAIAKKAGAARWRRYYQRQMLAKMRQESTTLSSEASRDA